MQLIAGQLSLTATDLSNFLSCRHRTALDMAVAYGKRKEPYFGADPLLELLIARGKEHERKYVEKLRSEGREVVDLSEFGTASQRVARTLDAMRCGAPVIVQGALADGRWFGYPDIMQRVEVASALGGWSYEIADTKLSRETKAGTILQLGLYSEMLATAQGKQPEYFYVVTPDPEKPILRFRVHDYAAYFRLVRRQMLAAVDHGDETIAATYYPEPCDHCDICPWNGECKQRREADDHLSLVAGITRLHRRELGSLGVTTMTGLAGWVVPTPFKPSRGSVETYVRAREQAIVQHESRDKTPPLYKLRDVVEKEGLCRLPEPSPGDIFLDLEGDALAEEGGREYLFGVVLIGKDGQPEYRFFWAFDAREEREAFEHAMDLIMASWREHEGMHVYHYAPYEPGAFKRLMGRYATREQDLDRLLRGGRFIDLYGVVRQAMWAGAQSYSIKRLEPIYGYRRAVDLEEANYNLRRMEQALWFGTTSSLPREILDSVKGYNRDDCVSTLRLRDWLESLRMQLVENGKTIARPVAEPEEATTTVKERELRVNQLRSRLIDGIGDGELTGEPRARWILAYLLDWHRREDKATWWEYFRLRDLPEEDLYDEPQAIAGLTFVETVERVKHKKTKKPTGSVIDRYSYEPQEMEVSRGAELKVKDDVFGEVVAIDRKQHTIDIRKGRKQAANHPTAVFAHTWFNPREMEDAIFRIAKEVANDGAVDGGRHSAARDLLLALPPRLKHGQFKPAVGEGAVDFAVRLVNHLDETVLAIQGPPGSGKTYTGARMICELVKAGKKVGVTANSHKVIRNLLDKVAEEAAKEQLAMSLAHKQKEGEDDDDDDDASHAESVKVIGDNDEALELLTSGSAQVLGGTAWLWSRDEFTRAVDVLFVDEAGQMSLANVVAVSQAAAYVVLLGDPRQLEQPRKGTHPDGVGVSALQHFLGGHQTIPPDRGIFLPVTWRLAPSICAYTSEMFYEDKLESKPGLERQVVGAADFDGNGLFVVEVDHDGNRSSSMEEVDVVFDLVKRLTAPGARWTSEGEVESQLTGEDILVVAPYNAQVSRLAERLKGTGACVGTVDKFQGQEAPVAIYSMATSRPEDAPRGMEFLFSPNRLNVATSRARCAAILVASPRLFEPECRSPRQMKLANGLCWTLEICGSPERHTVLLRP